MLRLDKITTQVKDDGWQTVTRYQLGQSYPDPDPSPPPGVTGSVKKMQLDSIQRAGASGQNVPQPTKFTYAYLYNRVNYPTGVSPMATARLSTSTSEIGGQTVFGYGRPEPCAQNTQYNFADHHLDCFPAFYGVGPYPGWIPFNKWVVTAEYEIDLAGGQPVQATSYTYSGGPGWHYSMSPVLPDNGTTSNPPRAERNWNEFRGFAVVTATDTIGGAITRSWFYQGMDGDRASVANPNLVKSVSISLAYGELITDVNNRAGLEADQAKYRLSDGGRLWRRRTDYTQSANPTNGFTPGTQTYQFIPWQSWFVAPSQVDETTLDQTSGVIQYRTSRVTYPTYDAYGHALTAIHAGDLVNPADDWHIDRTYVPADPVTWIHGLVTSEISRTGSTANAGATLTKTEHFYDSTGFETKTRRWTDQPTPTSYDTNMAPDALGRIHTSTDSNSHTTTYDYDPLWGPVGFTKVKNASNQEITTVADRRFGLPKVITDANNHTATEEYDELGRLTKVWRETEPTTGRLSR